MVTFLVVVAIFTVIALLMGLYHHFIATIPIWSILLYLFLWHQFMSRDVLIPFFEDVEKLIRRWRKIEHKSGLPMAEWEDRQRQKELDEKLTAGTYTDAEKEYLIYTAQLETEKKDELRKKHLPKNKRKPGI